MTKFSIGCEFQGASGSPKKRRRGSDGEDDRCEEACFSDDYGDQEAPSKVSVTIDPDVLDCTICLEPLAPPVYQCDNGHTACSSCCSKLKNKCPTCCWPIGYSRCLAIEKVIESVKISCGNACYGCKEQVGYTQKRSHEESCIYSPCACPISSCAFLGSSEQLSLHFSCKHWDSAIRVRYNCPISTSLDKSQQFVILQSEDGHLFLLHNGKEKIGNAISLTSIGLSSPDGGFSYDLIVRDGGRCLRLKSFTKCVLRSMERSPSTDFLLVPDGFHSNSEELKMEVCIWSSR